MPWPEYHSSSSLRRSLALLALVAGLCAAPLGAMSQTTPEVLRQEGEALLYGLNGQTADVPAGLERLAQAAAEGDAQAAAVLGKVLMDGYYTDADPARAEVLLRQAVAEGQVAAMVTLGQSFLWGLGVPLDPVQARDFLSQAAAKGDVGAQKTLGENLIGGWLMSPDADEGVRLLQAAIDSGDVDAKVTLGGFLLAGRALPEDRPRALALFEEAAKAGNPKGLALYGEDMMWGERGAEIAERYLFRAAEGGYAPAWAILAEGAMYGYLGGGSVSRAKFDGFAEKARAAGVERIEVLDATRRMWGISMRASGPETLAFLRDAADTGNSEAARALINLLRDGNHYNTFRNLPAAREALENYGKLLPAKDVERFEFTFAAAQARSDTARADLAEQLAADPGLKAGWLGKELLSANMNAAVYLAQSTLRSRGVYSGPLDGFAGRGTLRALMAACHDLPPGAICNDGLLRPEVLGAIITDRRP